MPNCIARDVEIGTNPKAKATEKRRPNPNLAENQYGDAARAALQITFVLPARGAQSLSS
jgi:hypothetical protein